MPPAQSLFPRIYLRIRPYTCARSNPLRRKTLRFGVSCNCNVSYYRFALDYRTCYGLECRAMKHVYCVVYCREALIGLMTVG